jgi:exosortase
MEGNQGLALDADLKKRLLLAAVAFAFIVYAYGIAKTCLLGITGSPAASLLGWLLVFWSRGQEYAHGYLVPIVAAGVFFWKWKTGLHRVPLTTSNIGLVLIVGAVVLYWVGVRGAVPRLLAASLIVLIYGLILYLAGWQWAKELWFPCAFLLFMIPVNFLDAALAFPLRLFVAQISTDLLNLLGVGVSRIGTGIHSLTGRFSPLDVADPCSGIRSLVALMALTALYGYVTMDLSWKKWVLFLTSIPLAVIGNLARIITVALVAQGFGEDLAMKIYHDYSGYIVFSLAILCMIAVGAGLNIRYSELIYRWTKEEVPLPQRQPTRNGTGRAQRTSPSPENGKNA